MLYIILITIWWIQNLVIKESQHTKNFWEDFKSLLIEVKEQYNNNNQYGLAHDPKKAFAE